MCWRAWTWWTTDFPAARLSSDPLALLGVGLPVISLLCAASHFLLFCCFIPMCPSVSLPLS